jgi:hypothetical protein
MVVLRGGGLLFIGKHMQFFKTVSAHLLPSSFHLLGQVWANTRTSSRWLASLSHTHALQHTRTQMHTRPFSLALYLVLLVSSLSLSWNLVVHTVDYWTTEVSYASAIMCHGLIHVLQTRISTS